MCRERIPRPASRPHKRRSGMELCRNRPSGRCEPRTCRSRSWPAAIWKPTPSFAFLPRGLLGLRLECPTVTFSSLDVWSPPQTRYVCVPSDTVESTKLLLTEDNTKLLAFPAVVATLRQTLPTFSSICQPDGVKSAFQFSAT